MGSSSPLHITIISIDDERITLGQNGCHAYHRGSLAMQNPSRIRFLWRLLGRSVHPRLNAPILVNYRAAVVHKVVEWAEQTASVVQENIADMLLNDSNQTSGTDGYEILVRTFLVECMGLADELHLTTLISSMNRAIEQVQATVITYRTLTRGNARRKN